MPFSENGIVPDVIINPNAFPSRMTIGMLIESMAGKAGALEGKIQETEPFKPYEDDDPVKYFGKELKKHGYNYYGNEVMYSGKFFIKEFMENLCKLKYLLVVCIIKD